MAQPILDDKTIYLVDGSGYIFRAFFAIRPLHSKRGVPTNAVYGFTTMLMKLLKEHQPKFLAIVFDRKEPTFRHRIYPAYKANRPVPPDELVPQFELIFRIVEAFNIKMLSLPGFEADDLIATMAKKANEEALREVVIVTGDKDLMQLVNERTFLLDELRALRNGGEQFIDIDEVKKELGVWPHQVVDLLALCGDASDNVPGVDGIGKKTAADLINEFGSLERILEMVPLIKQKSRQEKLKAGHNLALLSKKLVTIDNQVPIDCSIADLKYTGINQDQVRSLFLELDFNRLLQDEALFGSKTVLTSASLISPSIINRDNYITITDIESLDRLIKQLYAVKKIAINAITDGSDSNTTNLTGLSLAWGDNQAVYIPIAHSSINEQISLDLLKERFNKLLTDPSKLIIAQNAKYDYKVLIRHGFKKYKIGGDPMLQNYLLHQDQERHNLVDLSVKYLNHQPPTLEEICGSKKNHIPFAQLPIKIATQYAAENADLALRLEQLLLKDLQISGLEKLYYEMELPLEEVLAHMELVGVKIDIEVLKELKTELERNLLELEKKAHSLAGMDFNLASPKQVAMVLFEKLALPTQKKTKTGYSTDSFVLEKLAVHHPLAQVLLDHRMCAKLINTYIDTLPMLINKDSKRLHTTYNQFVAVTGRLSSSEPNLQNIPIRTKIGKRIRRAFVSEPGYCLISLDYSQVELRILAMVSQDPVLLDSFAKDQDVHRRTASEIFEIDSDQVTKEQRNVAKTINFGLLYGMGVQKLSETLHIKRADAQAYLNKYFDKYAGIFRWKNDVLALAKRKYEVRTLFGRRRSLPELASKNTMEQARGERLAINTPIQGTAADIIKKAMIDTDQYLSKHSRSARLIMQVHDELVIEAPIDQAEKIASDVAQIMTHGHGLNIELKVDYAIGANWDEAH